MIELNGGRILERNIAGGKAHYTSLLISLGLRVPPSIVLPIEDASDGHSDAIRWIESINCNLGNWRLAVRSSSKTEDSRHESKAGHFLTLIGEFDRHSLLDAIEKVRTSGPNMAVLIQPLIDARFSGVAFSCNPLTYNRSDPLIVWTDGLAEQLVSGNAEGRAIRITNGNISDGHWPCTSDSFRELLDGMHLLEKVLTAPADIEWVVDQNERLWFVQARPVAIPKSARIPLDSEANFLRLPGVVIAHSKIRLRRHAAKCGVKMSPAAVEIVTGRRPDFIHFQPPEFRNAAGVSVVLLHPEHINGRIVREFAPLQDSNIEFFTRGCRRYAVRRYPRSCDMNKAKAEVLQAGLDVSWISVVIEQAVWDAYATGIIRKTTVGFIVELALGHFVPKGVVPTSTIIMSSERRLLESIWRNQATVYHFVEGHVVTETPPRNQLRLKEPEIANIVDVFEPAFEGYENAALEFGLLKNGEKLDAYLIDAAEADVGAASLDIGLICSGVISVGSCEGRLRKMDSLSAEALDSHLNDRVQCKPTEGENIIIVAERTSVDLLRVVGTPGLVGFVFAEGSVLAHFSVILREKGIPAIVLDDPNAFSSLPLNCVVRLDAANPALTKVRRIVT
ncbi:MAG: PEP/pyruvate-binding domain-containing protein [Negativicutes bacterium]|nr:PEP/pyruvate-binding domain-containing protein [Negativicutes bacterium]